MIAELKRIALRRRSPDRPTSLAELHVGLTDEDIGRLRKLLDELERAPRGRAASVSDAFDVHDTCKTRLWVWRIEPSEEQPPRQRFDLAELEVVGRALKAIVEGPFFPASRPAEFDTVMGLSRDEVRAIADRWPDVVMDTEVFVAVNNTLNNLLGYPHRQEEALVALVAEPAVIARLLAKWRVGKPTRYFDAMS